MTNTSRAVILDIEATCGDANDTKQEIIHIGAVRTYLGKIELRYEAYIHPEDTTLTSWCSRLTGIDQEVINERGQSLERTFAEMKRELQTDRYPMMSWGNWDRQILIRETARKNLNWIFSTDFINIQSLFGVLEGRKNQASVVDAFTSVTGFSPDHFGYRNHNALDDAIMAATVWIAIQDRFVKG